MKSVKIYRLQNNGDEKIIVTCVLIGQGVICKGDKIFIENLEKQGIKDYANRTSDIMLFPKDGIKFLENLKYAFKSAYLSATDVEE